jgi:hypothetical protein
MRYLELEFNEPSRSDYYLALIAAETRRSYVKHPGRVKLESMILKFKPSRAAKPEQSTLDSKRFWLASVGLPTKVLEAEKE